MATKTRKMSSIEANWRKTYFLNLFEEDINSAVREAHAQLGKTFTETISSSLKFTTLDAAFKQALKVSFRKLTRKKPSKGARRSASFSAVAA